MEASGRAPRLSSASKRASRSHFQGGQGRRQGASARGRFEWRAAVHRREMNGRWSACSSGVFCGTGARLTQLARLKQLAVQTAG